MLCSMHYVYIYECVQVSGRNLDYKQIIEKTRLPPKINVENWESSSSDVTGTGILDLRDLMKPCNIWRLDEYNRELMIEQHDFIFWCGDLNYRIHINNSTNSTTSGGAGGGSEGGGSICHNSDDIFELVEGNVYNTLVPYDQLVRECKKGTVFQGYKV